MDFPPVVFQVLQHRQIYPTYFPLASLSFNSYSFFLSLLFYSVYILQGLLLCQRASFWCAVLPIFPYLFLSSPFALVASGHKFSLLFFSSLVSLLSLLFILTIKTVSIRRSFVRAVDARVSIWGRRILRPTPHSSNLHLSIHRT